MACYSNSKIHNELFMISITNLFTPAGDLAGDEFAPAEDALTGVFAAGTSSPLAFLPPSDSELGARWRFRPFPLVAEGPAVKRCA